MNTIINIKEIKESNGWYNITTQDGKQISINQTSNPITSEKLKNNPISIEINLVNKDGKFFGWDIKEQKQGGFKQMTPEQIAEKKAREDSVQRAIIAQSSISSASNYYAQRSEGTPEKIIALANDFYEFVMMKSK